MKAILYISIILSSLNTFSQDLTGNWKGKLTQTNAPYSNYRFEMELVQTGQQIVGISTIRVQQQYGQIELKGSFDGEIFKFQESKVIKERIKRKTVRWCIKKASLRFWEKEGYYYLQGDWEGKSEFGRCSPGTIQLRKKKPKVAGKQTVTIDTIRTNPVVVAPPKSNFKGRKIVKKQAYLQVKNTELVLQVWDHKEVDGDIISLYLNDKLVLEKHTLTNYKHQIKVNINAAGNNYLVLHAHNLGRVKPNTAAIAIHDGVKRQIKVLRSNLNESEIINIKYSY